MMARLTLYKDARGAALVELAIALPVLVALLIGVMGYGQYFLIAHDAQQLANDAARAAIAGLTRTERETLAKQHVTDSVAALGIVAPSQVVPSVRESSDRITVSVRIDASSVPLLGTSLIPMPDPMIVRHAVVMRGEID